MPRQQLPTQAVERIPGHAADKIIERSGLETYATVDFVGQSSNPFAVGPLIEVDDNSWVEANTWFFEEVSETNSQVVLYDASRGTTLTIDYLNDLIHVVGSTGYHLYDYDVTGVTYSLTPVENYATVNFVGQSINPGAVGPIVEIDDNTWLEADTWYFEEVSVNSDQVVLYDASRGTTLTIDYTTGLIHVVDSTGYHLYDYDITGVTYTSAPVIPDGWTL